MILQLEGTTQTDLCIESRGVFNWNFGFRYVDMHRHQYIMSLQAWVSVVMS